MHACIALLWPSIVLECSGWWLLALGAQSEWCYALYELSVAVTLCHGAMLSVRSAEPKCGTYRLPVKSGYPLPHPAAVLLGRLFV